MIVDSLPNSIDETISEVENSSIVPQNWVPASKRNYTAILDSAIPASTENTHLGNSGTFSCVTDIIQNMKKNNINTGTIYVAPGVQTVTDFWKVPQGMTLVITPLSKSQTDLGTEFTQLDFTENDSTKALTIDTQCIYKPSSQYDVTQLIDTTSAFIELDEKSKLVFDKLSLKLANSNDSDFDEKCAFIHCMPTSSLVLSEVVINGYYNHITSNGASIGIKDSILNDLSLRHFDGNNTNFMVINSEAFGDYDFSLYIASQGKDTYHTIYDSCVNSLNLYGATTNIEDSRILDLYSAYSATTNIQNSVLGKVSAYQDSSMHISNCEVLPTSNYAVDSSAEVEAKDITPSLTGGYKLDDFSDQPWYIWDDDLNRLSLLDTTLLTDGHYSDTSFADGTLTHSNDIPLATTQTKTTSDYVNGTDR